MNSNILGFGYSESNKKAINLFESIKDFKDSSFKIQDCEANINRRIQLLRIAIIALICLAIAGGWHWYSKNYPTMTISNNEEITQNISSGDTSNQNQAGLNEESGKESTSSANYIIVPSIVGKLFMKVLQFWLITV